MMMEKETVALLGLGTMGSGMAANLLKAGYPLAVYNRTKAKGEPLAALGARLCDTPAEAAVGADVVISMLSDDAASREAWTGENGALTTVGIGSILIESSTVSPVWVAELAALASQAGAELVDAPVTGSRVHAESGQLNFLAGGNAATVEAITPLLRVMGKDVQHLGPVGSGAKLKLINNFLCGVQAASLAEGLAWLERSGLDREKSLAILKGGAPGSPLLASLSARMVNRDYTVNFALKLMSKDLQYAHDEAAANGIDLTTAANARALFENAAERGFGEKDMSSVVEPVRDSSRS
ncbi:MAG TPA: NAD(P)-dependent oxidoreductase [Acidobacteriaceae bacterium]